MDSDDVKTPWFYPSAPKQQGYEVDCAKLNGAKKGEDSITIGVYSAPGFCRLEQGWHPDLILGEELFGQQHSYLAQHRSKSSPQFKPEPFHSRLEGRGTTHPLRL